MSEKSSLTLCSCEYNDDHVKIGLYWVVQRNQGYLNPMESQEIIIYTPNGKLIKIKLRIVSNDNSHWWMNVEAYNEHSSSGKWENVGSERREKRLDETFTFDSTIKIQHKETTTKAEKASMIVDLRNFSNFTIKCKDSAFMVHKAILEARSPVFRAMLKPETMEAQENWVEIPDFEPNIVEKMIQFLETDNVDSTHNCQIELYKIARKYQIESFMKYTFELMLYSLSFKNCCERLQVAFTYEDGELKALIKNFIRYNLLHIRSTEGFSLLSNDLIIEIIKEL